MVSDQILVVRPPVINRILIRFSSHDIKIFNNLRKKPSIFFVRKKEKYENVTLDFLEETKDLDKRT